MPARYRFQARRAPVLGVLLAVEPLAVAVGARGVEQRRREQPLRLRALLVRSVRDLDGLPAAQRGMPTVLGKLQDYNPPSELRC